MYNYPDLHAKSPRGVAISMAPFMLIRTKFEQMCILDGMAIYMAPFMLIRTNFEQMCILDGKKMF
jgi:hypothetical protein